MSLPRLAIIGDFVEENWPSMWLVEEMLCKHLQREAGVAPSLMPTGL